MTIAEFDHLSIENKKELLQQCCGSSAWVNKMLAVFPVEDLVDLEEYAEEKWYECSETDWMEAFEQNTDYAKTNYDQAEEIKTAAEEQLKTIKNRLEKIFA